MFSRTVTALIIHSKNIKGMILNDLKLDLMSLSDIIRSKCRRKTFSAEDEIIISLFQYALRSRWLLKGCFQTWKTFLSTLIMWREAAAYPRSWPTVSMYCCTDCVVLVLVPVALSDHHEVALCLGCDQTFQQLVVWPADSWSEWVRCCFCSHFLLLCFVCSTN